MKNARRPTGSRRGCRYRPAAGRLRGAPRRRASPQRRTSRGPGSRALRGTGSCSPGRWCTGSPFALVCLCHQRIDPRAAKTLHHLGLVVIGKQLQRRPLAVAVVVVACLCATALYLGRTVFGGSGTRAQYVAVPFATLPGGEYEPAFSPDGNRIVTGGGDGTVGAGASRFDFLPLLRRKRIEFFTGFN